MKLPEEMDIALVYESHSYKSEAMVPLKICQQILGSSSSFSTGGPGKGMHSRCTTNLMNRTHCLESVSN